jgi:hypothetical protein
MVWVACGRLHTYFSKKTMSKRVARIIRIQGVRDSIKTLKNDRELKVWQRSYHLCLEIYNITTTFPDEERYGLTSPIRRAAASFPSNAPEEYRTKPLDPLNPQALCIN